MKNNILMKLWAIMLALCLAVTSVSTVQMVRVYASEEDGDGYADEDYDNDTQDPDADKDPDDNQDPNAPQDPDAPQQDPSIIDPVLPPDPPDPSDYNLACYNTDINFGNVNQGDVIMTNYFNIVNTGNSGFPLGWDEVDYYTAFALNMNGDSNYLDEGQSITFSICPLVDLTPGPYTAGYTFYNQNDPQRKHSVKVTVNVVVNGSGSHITDVTIIPGKASVPRNNTFQFSATVDGDGDYDHSVVWAMEGHSSPDTCLDQTGKLFVASDESSSNIRVYATSKQDPDYGDIALVSVTNTDFTVHVKADPSDGGAVAGDCTVRSGDSCSISASANNNYVFKGWFEGTNQISSNNQTTITNITSNREFVAKFERVSCKVNTSVNDSNGGTITGSSSVNYGGSMKIQANANDGYYFDRFVENGNTITDSDTLELNNITTDRNIQAVFYRKQCKVHVCVSPDQSGAVDGGGKYDVGSKVNLQAYPTDGYVFAGWTINGQTVSRDTRYTIDKIRNDISVCANFMKKGAVTFPISASIANQGGIITPSGNVDVPQGGSATFTIMPQPGYIISAVMVDGKNIGPVTSYTFNNVQGTHAIAAGFAKAPVDPGKGSSGKGSATVTVKNNTNQSNKTEYNNNTAAEGAVQEQNVVYTDIPENLSELDSDAYASDVYTISLDNGTADSGNAMADSVMVKHNYTEDELRKMIMEGDVLALLREAYDNGNLKITVNNSFAADKQETAVELYYKNPTLTNFEDVIAETLTDEEKFKVLTGSEVAFNIDISDSNDTIDTQTKNAIKSKVGYKPVSYFDFVILKTSDGVTSVIDSTKAELEVVLPIPEKFKKNGRKFVVLRDHNGDVDVLKDLGDDSDTIRFKSDKFSQYAIAYEVTSANKLVLRFFIIAVVALILAILCVLNLLRFRRHNRRHGGLVHHKTTPT